MKLTESVLFIYSALLVIALVVLQRFDKTSSYTLLSTKFYGKTLSMEEKYSQLSPRVFIDGSNMYNPTGGPEALIQLTLAFNSLLPNCTRIIPYRDDTSSLFDIVSIIKAKMGNRSRFKEFINIQFQNEYPEVANVPIGHVADMTRGDILILPEIFSCPESLLAKGINVYIWVLRADEDKLFRLKQSGCLVVSHNHWISNILKLDGIANDIFTPYISPSLIPRKRLDLSLKEDLLLIDNDTPEYIVSLLDDICVSLGCEAVVVDGYKRVDLLVLYKKAKIVVDWCMLGTERMPIEAVLNGAILITSECGCGQEVLDFPIPPENFVSQINVSTFKLRDVVTRAMTHYEDEYGKYKNIRQLYEKNISALSLRNEVKMWLIKNNFVNLSLGEHNSNPEC